MDVKGLRHALSRLFDPRVSSVVCLHGLGRTPADWDPIAPRLEEFGSMVAPQLPCDRLDELLQPGAIVIGHSMGAVEAMRLLARRPRPLRALVLTGCFFPPARNGRSTAASLLDYGAHRVAFVRNTRGERTQRAGTGSIRPLASLLRQTVRPEPEIDQRHVLVVHARDDHHVPVDFAIAAARRRPEWALRVLPDGGHHAHVTRPEEWAETVSAWLRPILREEFNGVKSSTMTSSTRLAITAKARGARHAAASALAAHRFVVLGLVLLFGFTAVFSAAFHAPRPHEVRVAVVGGPQALTRARGALDPQRFIAIAYPSEAAARAAILRQDVSGALVGDHVLVASAAGFNASQATAQALTAVAARAGINAKLTDLRPLPAHDGRGLSSFVTVTSTTIASIVFAVLLTLIGQGHALRARLTALLLIAGLGGVAVALSVDTTVGALTDDFWGVAGVISLLILAVVLCVHGLGRLIGHAGAGIAALTLVLVGVTSSGGGVGPTLQPGFYRAVSHLLPNGAAVTALRNEVYFGGAHSLGALIVLGGWAAGGAAALLIGHHRGPLFTLT